jgi:molybdate-binding protein/transcriptional regulator with XRE-family HTH domain
MSTTPSVTCRVKEERVRRGWSQEELARRSGISRAGVSAIEIGRLVPSAAAALALAAAMQCRVEDLFRLDGLPRTEADWAWPPRTEPCRYFEATVGDRRLRFPVEPMPLGMIEHDGVYRGGDFHTTAASDPGRTIVIACCDPAVGLLAREVARISGLRLLVVPRSSRLALDLLKQGLVHAAGVHLGKFGDKAGNAGAVRESLGRDFGLLRVARWQEGLATAPSRGIRSTTAALRGKLQWIGREAGSGARQCLDELLSGRKSPRRVAFDHRGVADAIRSGWADAGVCLRLTSEEAGLSFLAIRDEAYDICLPRDYEADPRLKALAAVVRSANYRRLLGELPGYDSSETGRWQPVA